MSTKRFDLGAVSAYAMAVEGGYQGTEEEFGMILANAANYAAESRTNKEAAETAAGEAAGSAQEARDILSDVNAAGANQIQAIETAGAEQTEAAKAEIDAKGKQTLDSIPEDYTGLQTEVDELKQDLGKLDESLSDKKTLNGANLGNKYIRTGGSIGNDSSCLLYKYDVSIYKGKTIKVETIATVSTPTIGFYTRGYSIFTENVSDAEIISVVSGNNTFVDVPNNAATMCVMVDVSAGTIPNVYTIQYISVVDLKGEVADLKEIAHSTNLLNTNAIVHGKYVTTSGYKNDSSVYCHTDYIPVKTGDTIGIFADFTTVHSPKYITAYDSNKQVLKDKGYTEGQQNWSVGENVAFVIVSMYESRVDDTTRININGRKPFEPYWEKEAPIYTDENKKKINDICEFTLTTLPKYLLKTLSYRPIGYLEKGYICLVSDDGNSELATYTIPMLNQKNVPCTFALMSTSQVMKNDSEKTIVLDAINNHNCKVAQHGDYYWTKYSEREFVEYLDSQEQFFNANGMEITSGVCPAHEINDIVRAVGGGRWGVLRTGYGSTGSVEYDRMCGARSNLYALPAHNIVDYDLDYWKEMIDSAITNHYILIPFWHDNALNETQRTKMEQIIDYAKSKSVQFVTLDEIPLLR